MYFIPLNIGCVAMCQKIIHHCYISCNICVSTIWSTGGALPWRMSSWSWERALKRNWLVVDGVYVVFSLAEQVHYCTQFHVTAPVLALPVWPDSSATKVTPIFPSYGTSHSGTARL